MDLCEALQAQGIEVHLASPAPSDPSWLMRTKVRHFETPRRGNQTEVARRLLDLSRTIPFDGAINNDNPVLQSIAPLIAFPVIAVAHMSKSSIATLAAFNVAWLDYVVAISYDMQRALISKYQVPVIKCPVVHSGIVERSEFKLPVPSAGPRRPLRLVFAGGDNKRYKAADLVAELLCAQGYTGTGAVLYWYGQVREDVRGRFAERQDVVFKGRVGREQFLRELSECDVFVFPSRYEGCPIALMEAMSYGLIPIVSDGIGAMRWMLMSGVEGYVVPLQGWANQAAQVVEYLSQNSDAVARMRQSSRKRFEKCFRMERVCEFLMDLLSRPTVKRLAPPVETEILRWHRPLRPDGRKAPLLDRLCIRLGILRREGLLRPIAMK